MATNPTHTIHLDVIAMSDVAAIALAQHLARTGGLMIAAAPAAASNGGWAVSGVDESPSRNLDWSVILDSAGIA